MDLQFNYSKWTHLGKIGRWVLSSAQVRQGPYCIAGCWETIGFSQQSRRKNTGSSHKNVKMRWVTYLKKKEGDILLQGWEDATVQHVVSAFCIITCYIPQCPDSLKQKVTMSPVLFKHQVKFP